MKKILLSLSLLLFVGAAMAQEKKKTISENPAYTNPSQVPATTLKPENMAFADMVHDFGSVQEGPDALCEFSFKNTGTEPIIIQKAQPSCGCTVPSFSSEPVPPGGTGTINVAFHTKGKSNAFTKTITVLSNAGTKVLTIKGSVEKAPTGSVPENTSMIKTN
jgi:hypothetical protein